VLCPTRHLTTPPYLLARRRRNSGSMIRPLQLLNSRLNFAHFVLIPR